MRIRIQLDNIQLTPESRSRLESRFRMELGARSSDIHEAQVALAQVRTAQDEVSCRITVKNDQGLQASVLEQAAGHDAAIEWAIWRLKHRLDRRALRT